MRRWRAGGGASCRRPRKRLPPAGLLMNAQFRCLHRQMSFGHLLHGRESLESIFDFLEKRFDLHVVEHERLAWDRLGVREGDGHFGLFRLEHIAVKVLPRDVMIEGVVALFTLVDEDEGVFGDYFRVRDGRVKAEFARVELLDLEVVVASRSEEQHVLLAGNQVLRDLRDGVWLACDSLQRAERVADIACAAPAVLVSVVELLVVGGPDGAFFRLVDRPAFQTVGKIVVFDVPWDV